CRKIIYISSTGVYPNQEGVWEENTTLIADTVNGALRLMTEKVLGEFFELKVIRPGGIYGRERNLITRLIHQQTIPETLRPTHRIHVRDLASILSLLIQNPDAPKIINAVDMDPMPSVLALMELANHPEWFPGVDASVWAAVRKLSQPDPTLIKNRLIANQLLINRIQYPFQFPTFREGFPACFR
ncbi:MAG: hypothetical protein HQM12_12935, partial [SAR324 cluster bacterium]|nr:hypothetical protein [SAR324 cluster bacterium]